MRGLQALILAGVLLAAVPARADFFDDLGGALDKLGNSIGNAAKDVGNTVDEAFTRKPDQNQADQPQAKPEITWNPPPPVTSFSGATLYAPATAARPRPVPEARRNFASPAVNRPSINSTTRQVDDAPPPHRAPYRAPVQAAYIGPLPGFTQAPPRPAAVYSPVLAAASLEADHANIPLPTRLPGAKPTVVQNRSFAVRFNNRHVTLDDRLVQANAAAPTGESKALIEAVARSLQASPDQRIRLHSEAIVESDRLSEARRRSADRAMLVKNWLQAAGARPTQIDLDVSGAGNADAVTLDVYAAR